MSEVRPGLSGVWLQELVLELRVPLGLLRISMPEVRGLRSGIAELEPRIPRAECCSGLSGV
eukprot:10912527-Alexandrium_andersonii.AAC.1